MKVTKLDDILSNLTSINALDDIDIYAESFITYYSNNGHNQYSEVLRFISSKDLLDDDVDFLIGKLQDIITNMSKSDNDEDVKATVQNLHKLVDYIKLEVARKQQLHELEEAISAYDKKIERVNADIDKQQMNAITVIGLFSAIIMSFFGGISFTSSSIKGMASVSPLRLAFILSLTGFVIFNIIYMVMYVIGKYVGKSIGNPCKYRECNDCGSKCEHYTKVCRFTNRYVGAILVNTVLLIIMIGSFIIYIVQKLNLGFVS